MNRLLALVALLGVLVASMRVLPAVAQEARADPEEASGALSPPSPKPPKTLVVEGDVPFFAEVLVVKRDWSTAKDAEQAAAEFEAAIKDVPVPEAMRKESLRRGLDILFSTTVIYQAERFEGLAAWLKRHDLLVSRTLGDRLVRQINQDGDGRQYFNATVRLPYSTSIQEGLNLAETPLVETHVEWTWRVLNVVESNEFGVQCDVIRRTKAIGATEFTQQTLATGSIRAFTGNNGQVVVLPGATPVRESRGFAQFQGGLGFNREEPPTQDVLLVVHVGNVKWPPSFAEAPAAVAVPNLVLPDPRVAQSTAMRDRGGGRPSSTFRGGTGNPITGGAGRPATAPAAVMEPTVDVLTEYRLERISADDTAILLRQLLGDTVRIAVVPGENRIMVKAAAEMQTKLKDILSKLDAPKSAEPNLDTGGGATGAAKDSGAVTGLHGGGRSPTNALAAQAMQAEQQSLKSAARLREILAASASAETPVARTAQRQLTKEVTEAFDSRQQLYAAQIAEFEQRLADLKRTYELRQRAKSQIIERRVEQLQSGDLRWDAVEGADTGSSMSPPAGATPRPGRMPAGGSSSAIPRPSGVAAAAAGLLGGGANDSERTEILRSPGDFYKALSDTEEHIANSKARVESLKVELEKAIQLEATGTPLGFLQNSAELSRQLELHTKSLARLNRDLEFLNNEYASQVMLLEAHLRNAEAKAVKARQDCERMKSLVERKLVAQAELQQTEAVFDTASANLERAKVLLELYRKVPISSSGTR